MIQTAKSQIRSLKENKYYFGIICKMITEFQKWKPGQAHGWIKVTFGIDTTTELTTLAFENLMEEIRQHCFVYWNLNIPLPNED